jgi:fused signal recognition particle receptor
MGIFTKTAEFFKDRLGKTRDKISSSLSAVLSLGRDIDDALLDELEETLITDDIGVETTDKLISDLRTAYRSRQIAKTDDIIPFLKEHIKGYWPDRDRQLHLAQTGPTVILVAGVNGSGKTTSIAKLAHILSQNNRKVIVAACDTFRAAAVEQLSIWAERIGVQIVKHKSGGDPAAVAFDACEAATARAADVLILDTAGRLHTQKDLMSSPKRLTLRGYSWPNLTAPLAAELLLPLRTNSTYRSSSSALVKNQQTSPNLTLILSWKHYSTDRE